jgi:predicted O-methyltransferase YrrM
MNTPQHSAARAGESKKQDTNVVKTNVKFRGIKAYIPTPALNMVRIARAQNSIKQATKKTFNAANLIHMNNVQLGNWLQGVKCQKHWVEDQKVITKILGEQDKYGGVNPGDRQAIYTLLYNLKPKTVLEIGTHIGASTLYFASVLNRNKNGFLTSVDVLDVNADEAPWSKLGLPASPKENVKTINCSAHVEFIQSDSKKFLTHTDKKFDFIFLDGDHGAKTVYEEISLALNLLNPNGILLLHDYYPNQKPLFNDGSIIPGPFIAVKRIKSENPDICIHPLGALPWPTKQNSNMTSLAILARN